MLSCGGAAGWTLPHLQAAWPWEGGTPGLLGCLHPPRGGGGWVSPRLGALCRVGDITWLLSHPAGFNLPVSSVR